MVPFWKEALEMVLDVEPGSYCSLLTFHCLFIYQSRNEVEKMIFPNTDHSTEEDSAKIPDVSIVESSAELLYGLVHQRFILTKAGLSAMVSRPSHLS